MQTMSVIADASITKFGKSQKGLLQLASDAARPIIERHNAVFGDRDASERIRMVVANSYGAEFNGISGVHLQIARAIGLEGILSERADNISASGATALHRADILIKSGEADMVLVVGAEKMTHMPSTKDITTAISTLLFEEERAAGLTLPSLAGMMATACISEFGLSREDIANVAVQNRFNGSLNPNSFHYAKGAVTLEQVMQSRVIVSPLRLFEFCPNADGAAALLVVSDRIAAEFTDKPVFVRGIGMGADSALISSRSNFTSMPSVTQAAMRAYSKAGIGPKGIDVFEAHDMASILQPMQMIAAGILDAREAWTAATEGRTAIGGDIPVNTSGGLISCGHPIAVSGLKQAVEGFLQIRREAGERQAGKADTFAFASLGGFANSVIFTILSNDGTTGNGRPIVFDQTVSYPANGSLNGSVNDIGEGVDRIKGRVITTTDSYATANGQPGQTRIVAVELASGAKVIARGELKQKRVNVGDEVTVGRARKDGVPKLLRD